MPSDSFENAPDGALVGTDGRKSAFHDVNPSDGTWSPARAIVFVIVLTILCWVGLIGLIVALL